MKTSILFKIMVALVAIQSVGYGRVLFSMRDWDCPDKGVIDLIEDDETGKRYWNVIRCDGTTCLYPDEDLVGGEVPPYSTTGHIVQTPLTPHPDPEPINNFWQIVHQSVTITAPNTRIGVYVSEPSGWEHWPRTFINQAEKTYYEGLLWHEQNPLTIRESFKRLDLTPVERKELSWVTTTAPSFVLLPDGSNAAEGAKPHNHPEAATADYANSHAIMEAYASLLPQITDDSPRDNVSAWMKDYGQVLLHVRKTGSNLILEQLPTAGNGYTLTVSPIRNLLGGEVVVLNEAGQTVWKGEIFEKTMIPLSSLPSGTYFVRGMGKALALPIIR